MRCVKMIMFYFSGTGNSKYLAESFCKKTKSKAYSIEQEAMTFEKGSSAEALDFKTLVHENKFIGFCYPIYGSRIPKIMREFATSLKDELKGKKVILFATQNFFSGDGARVFTDLFPAHHFEVVLAEHFLMPNNVSNLFFYPLASEKRLAKYRRDIQAEINNICAELRRGIRRKRGFNPFSRLLGLTQGGVFPFIEKQAKDKVRILDSCNSCGLCVNICPAKNFIKEQDKILPQGECFLCYRCINQCPKAAIIVMFPFKVRKQYTGMEYKKV